MKNPKFKQHPNSLIAWRRNGFYGRLNRHLVELKQLKSYPLLDNEKARLELSIDFIENILKEKEISDKKFGIKYNFKKYEKVNK